MPCSTVQVADGHVEMVDAFVSLGSMIDSSGGSRGEVLHRIGIARSCMNLLEKKNLEVKHQAGYQNTPLPDLHSPCLVVWVRNMVHNKAPVLSHWCIWHVGTMQDPKDTIYSPCDECGSQSNHRMPSSLPPGHWQMFAALWTYCPQLTTRGPPLCCRCGDLGAASRLEATVRKT